MKENIKAEDKRRSCGQLTSDHYLNVFQYLGAFRRDLGDYSGLAGRLVQVGSPGVQSRAWRRTRTYRSVISCESNPETAAQALFRAS